MKYEVEIRYLALTADRKGLLVGGWVGCGSHYTRVEAVEFAENAETHPGYQARIREVP